jgi:hypothetical protein
MRIWLSRLDRDFVTLAAERGPDSMLKSSEKRFLLQGAFE